jgi:hypothetical protein
VRLDAEALLMLVIGFFFLKDSIRLLHQNEAVLVRGIGGRWRAGFGTRSWRLAGREPYLANPFLPHEAIVRLAWRMAAGPVDATVAAANPVAVPRELPRFGLVAWLIWAELFVLLPAALSGRVAGISPLLAIALLYATAVAAMVTVWWRRTALNLSNQAFRALAIDCIACPPYAANLVRRLAALQTIDEDFVAASRRLLTPQAQRSVDRECGARIDERIETESPEGDASALLHASRARFDREDDDGRQ